MRARNNPPKVVTRPVTKLPQPTSNMPTPMMSRRLVVSTKRDTGRLAKAVKAEAAKPTTKLTCVSVSCRSSLMDCMSRPIMAAFPKSVMTVRPMTATENHAWNGLGQGSEPVLAVSVAAVSAVGGVCMVGSPSRPLLQVAIA
jgi:hypothetical protein